MPYAVARTGVGNASGVNEYNTPHMIFDANDAAMFATRRMNAVAEWLSTPAVFVENRTNARREIRVDTVEITIVPFLPRDVSTAYIAATEPGIPANEIIT
jgi:hypothetical protein